MSVIGRIAAAAGRAGKGAAKKARDLAVKHPKKAAAAKGAAAAGIAVGTVAGLNATRGEQINKDEFEAGMKEMDNGNYPLKQEQTSKGTNFYILHEDDLRKSVLSKYGKGSLKAPYIVYHLDAEQAKRAKREMGDK